MTPPNLRRVSCCAACEHGVGPLGCESVYACTESPHELFHPSNLCDWYEED
jgi:hypothetical protein